MPRCLQPPLEGRWTFTDFPSIVRVELAEGNVRTFRRARLAQMHPGCVAQYREHRARNSMHLHVHFVQASGFVWRIDHTDDANPDVGPWSAIKHFVLDHPIARVLRGQP